MKKDWKSIYIHGCFYIFSEKVMEMLLSGINLDSKVNSKYEERLKKYIYMDVSIYDLKNSWFQGDLKHSANSPSLSAPTTIPFTAKVQCLWCCHFVVKHTRGVRVKFRTMKAISICRNKPFITNLTFDTYLNLSYTYSWFLNFHIK